MCAAVHSRAAYGYAMAAGHLASLYNFALLQTVRSLGQPCSTDLQQTEIGALLSFAWSDCRQSQKVIGSIIGRQAAIVSANL